MDLKEQKKINLFKIKNARLLLDKELETGLITEEDLISLLKVKHYFGLKQNNRKYSYKESVLKSIFNAPFVLCDQERLSLNLKKILPLFLQVRYEMEINELNYLYNNAYITKEELNLKEKLLKFCYYQSSNDGKNILKTGHLESFLDNKIKIR